jgi:hypothetical protein
VPESYSRDAACKSGKRCRHAIRENFTEMEKKLLNEAITGEVICPRGCTIDEVKAGTVGVKIKNLLREHAEKAKAR